MNEENKTITMVEGEFGVSLPITIVGAEMTDEDNLLFTIKNADNEEIINKQFTNIIDNTIDFVLTKLESDKLKKGYYFYSIDWFRNDEFMANIINGEIFHVEGKI